MKSSIFIGRFERLNEDSKKIGDTIFSRSFAELDANVNLSPMTTGAVDKLKNYYTDELQEMVYHSYLSDFVNFQYSEDL